MTSAILEGALLGFTLAFLVGPTFVGLIQTSIHHGTLPGIQFSIGVILSDLTIIALGYLGLLQIFGGEARYLAMGIAGGVVLIVFGIATYKKRHKLPRGKTLPPKFTPRNFFKHLAKGYLINILNPFLLIFWIGVTGLAGAKYGIPSRETYLFFTSTLVCIFITDMIKVLASRAIGRMLNARMLARINKTVGILMMALGLLLMLRVLFMR